MRLLDLLVSNLPDTSLSRKKVRKTLIRIAEEVEAREISGSDTEEEEDGASDSDTDLPTILGKTPSIPKTPVRKGRPVRGGRDLNTSSMAEGYFQAQAAKVDTTSALNLIS